MNTIERTQTTETSTHSARMWLFKSCALIFIFGGIIVAVIALIAGGPPAAAGPLVASLLGAIVWLLADIAESVFSR